MKYFKILILFFLSFSFYSWSLTINITSPDGSEKIKSPYTLNIQWTADWTGETRTFSAWEIYYSPTGNGLPNNPSNPGGDWIFLGNNGNDPLLGNFSWPVPNNINTNQATICVVCLFTNGERNKQKSASFIIDNTKPVSNLTISGNVVSGGTINYGGTWSDILSGPIHVMQARLYGNTTNDTGTAVFISDVTRPETSGVNSGYYGGSTNLGNIGNYKYYWVRIVIEDDAKDNTGHGNSEIDWSNWLTGPVLGINSISPSSPNGTINPNLVMPSAISDPPSPSYFPIPPPLPFPLKTGWYTQYPVLTINAPSFSPDSVVMVKYRIEAKDGRIYYYEVSGTTATINFSNYGDGQYQVKYWFRVKVKDKEEYYETQPITIPTQDLQDAGGGSSWNSGADPNYICIDTTPPTIAGIFVNKAPDGNWAILKDKGQYVQWYDKDPNKRPVIYFAPSEDPKPSDDGTSSGIFIPTGGSDIDDTGIGTGLHKHSIETTQDSNGVLFNYDFSTDLLEDVIDPYSIPNIPNIITYFGPLKITVYNLKECGFYFPVYNARGKEIAVGLYDRAGNIGSLKSTPLFIGELDEIDITNLQNYIKNAIQNPLYVDTIPPRTRVQITTDDQNYLPLWPTAQKDVGIPVDQTGNNDDGINRRWYKGINNIGFMRPEDATPPSGYPIDYVEHLFFASSENQLRTPTKFRLIATDTPRYSLTPFEWSLWPGWSDPKYPDHYKYRPEYDPRFSDFSLTNYGSGVSDDFQAPRYRRSFNLTDDIRVETDGTGPGYGKWESNWQMSNRYYLNQSVIYEDVSPGSINDWCTITDWFMLPGNVTSIEYFSIDNAGNEEVYPFWGDFDKNGSRDDQPVLTHHLIVDEGGGLVKGRKIEDIGKSNLRADDNVPDPDINMNPQNYNGENGWYISPVTISLTYNDSEKWKDPLPTGEPGSGIKKFQYALKNNPNPPNENEFIDYTYGRPFTLTDGSTWIYYRAIDNLGNRSGNITRPYIIYEKNPVRVDTVPPFTTINLSGENVTLTSSDVGSGVASISYRVRADLNDNTNWETVPYNNVSFNLPEGKKIVEYYAKDLAGNYEPLRRSDFGEQDKTPPTTYITYTGPYYNDGTNTYITSENNSNPTRFSLNATDGSGTGIRTGYPKYKKLPSTTEYTWTGVPFSLPSTSTGIEYWSKDVVDNEEIPHKLFPPSGSLIIDDVSPTITFTRDKNPDSQTGWYNENIGAPTITITASDNNPSILNSLYYSIDGSNPAIPGTIPTFNLTLTSDGIYNIVAKADDKLGNTSQNISYQFNPVKVDLTDPSSNLSLNNGIFTLSSQDATSGVKTIYWKYILSDGSQIQNSYNGSSTTFQAPSGLVSIEYWAVDYAGNEETHKTWNSSLADTTPPQTTINYSQPYYQKQTTLYVTSEDNTTSLLGITQFSINSTDPLVNNFASGIASGYPKYCLDSDGPNWIQYTNPFNVSSSNTKIYAYAKDAAENEEIPHKSLQFVVDDNPPSGTDISITGEYMPGPANTGWYNSITGRPKIKFTGTNDSDSGVKGIRYTIDGKDPDLSSQLVNIDTEFTLDDVKIDEGKFKYAGFDNLENRETIKSYDQNIWVDIKSPTTTINIDYNKKTFTLNATDQGLSGVNYSEYSFDGQNWHTYSGETPIPQGTAKIYAKSYDNAGNIEDPPVSIQIPYVKLSGYVKDYKGNLLSGVKVIIGGEINQITTTLNGYYEFSNLNALGNYYVIPLIQNSIPFIRFYNGLGSSNLTEQNFIIMNGWMSKNYDTGNSNDYYYRTNTTLPSDSKLVKEFTISKGGDILTGDLEGDGKLDLIVKDSNSFSVYHYNSSTKTYDLKFTKSTSYNLSLIDSIEQDTRLEILLKGTGKNLSEVYDKDGNKLKTISLSNPPDDTKWGIRFAQNNILFAGDGTNYETILLYDYYTDSINWETEISQKIIPENLNICVRNDGKVMVVFSGENDVNDVILYALDVFNGSSIFTKKLTGIRGKLLTFVSDIDQDGFAEIIGVRISSEANHPLTIYRFDAGNGNILRQVSTSNYTNYANVVISDIDNDGIKEVIVSDSSENIYVFDIYNGLIKDLKENKGKVWAGLDFDKKADNKKELVISKGSEISVVDSSLNKIMSYDLKDTILNVIVSDINNDGIIDIIASSPTKTYILRPSTLSDLPSPPTNLSGYATIDGVYLSWNYTSSGSPLSGFKVYRSIDGINWAEPVAIVGSDKNWYKDVPPSGMWYYKVSSYNDYGEVDCTNPGSVLISFSGISEGGGGGGCFIASLCFGEDSWQVKFLKEFRDRFLIKNILGRKFVKFYYNVSPEIAEYLRVHKLLLSFVKFLLYIIILSPLIVFSLIIILLIRKIKKYEKIA